MLLLIKLENFVIFKMNMFTLKKEMATHSSSLAWRIPWMEEPDGLQTSQTRLSDFMSHEMMPWAYTDEISEPQRQRENLVNFQIEGIPSKGERNRQPSQSHNSEHLRQKNNHYKVMREGTVL